MRLLLPATYSVGLSSVLSPCFQRTTERLVGQLLIRSIVRAQAHETCHSRSCRKVAPGSESQMAARIKSRIAVSARSLAGLYPKLYDLGQGGGRTSHWLRKWFETIACPKAYNFRHSPCVHARAGAHRSNVVCNFESRRKKAGAVPGCIQSGRLASSHRIT